MAEGRKRHERYLMHAHTRSLRAYLPLLLTAVLALCLAPATVSAAPVSGGIFTKQPALSNSFIATVTVTFNSNGGSVVDTQQVESGSLVATPVPDPTRTGFTFAGWYADAPLTTPWNFATNTVGPGDATLYAKWTVNNYHVAFESNGGSAVSAQTIAFGAHVTKPVPDPTRTGFTFAGWYANVSLTTPWNFATGTVGAADMTLYAKWIVTSYVVTFDSNGGSAVTAQSVAFGSHVPAPDPDPTRVGFTFAGWYSDAALTTPWNFATDTVGTADMTLHAKWTINNYHVVFDSNGGSVVASQSVAFGAHVAAPVPEPARPGYIFVGWFADAALTTPWDFATGTVGTADMTLHAKWTFNSYRVAFITNGGSAVTTQDVAFGSHVAAPVPAPTRPGYIFAGWFADAALTTPWNFATGTIGAADMSLYAKWTVNSYHVAFVTNGGSAVPTQSVAFGAHVASPTPAPTRTGYEFLGWFADSALTTPWDFSAGTVGAGDMTLYAGWAGMYKITGSVGSHGSLSIGSGATVGKGSSLTVTITPAAGYGVAAVKVDGVAKGRVTSYEFRSVTASHTISATFKRVTSTTLTASAKSVSKNKYVTLHATLKSTASSYSRMYVRFEVRLPGTSTYILLKNVKLSSTGKASYRYQVLNRGTRYHRVRFLETTSFLPAPLKSGLALRVK